MKNTVDKPANDGLTVGMTKSPEVIAYFHERAKRLASIRSEAKARASRENGKKGGRPRKVKS